MTQNRLKTSPKKTSKKHTHKKVYVDISKLNDGKVEYGLFALNNISSGETIFIAKGDLVRIDIRSAADSAKYPNALGLRRNLWLNPFDDNPLVYLNHSCSPNAGIQGSVTVVARKQIKKGEEVTIDYSTTECDELWELAAPCHCESKNCRKVIRSIQHLPVTIYKKYLPYIAKEMQHEYVRAHPNVRL